MAAATLSLLLVGACSGRTVPSSEAGKGESSPSPEPTTQQSPQPELSVASVLEIVDGDTARMSFKGLTNERVRFIGIDTPERGRPYFSEASNYTASHLRGNQVHLEFDVEERDRYGRVLAYVWLSPPASRSESEIRERMFNAKALLDGYAALLTVPPNIRYVDYFLRFQREAREGGRGLWALPEGGQSNGPGGPERCDPSYPDVCIPPPPPDLDCADVPHKNFRVLPPDPHGFDRDRDGFGCES